MDFFDVACSTRAIRRYRQDPIPAEDLSRILFVATRAPSGSNRQPFRFIVLRAGSPSPGAQGAREVLGRAFREMWAAKREGDGYDQGSGTETSSPKARMAATMQHFVNHVDEAPVIIFACAHLRHEGYTEGASVYPACQNLLLAARALGYGGVMTMWHQPVEDQLAELLQLPEDVRIAATIPLGQPVGSHGPVRRRPLPDLVYEDAWGDSAAWARDPEGTRFAGGPRRGPKA